MPMFPFYRSKSSLEIDYALHTQNCDGAHQEEMNHVLPFCIFNVMSLTSHVFAEQKSLL